MKIKDIKLEYRIRKVYQLFHFIKHYNMYDKKYDIIPYGFGKDTIMIAVCFKHFILYLYVNPAKVNKEIIDNFIEENDLREWPFYGNRDFSSLDDFISRIYRDEGKI